MNIKSFQYKLFFYLGIVLCLLLGSLGSAAFYYMYSSIMEDTLIANQELTKSTAENINNLFSEMDKLALYASTNHEVRKTMTELNNITDEENSFYYEKQTSILNVLTSVSVPNNSANYRMTIFNGTNFVETTGVPTSTTILNSLINSPSYNDWYVSLPFITNDESITLETYDIWTNSDISYITLYREIFHYITSTLTVGAIQIQCPIASFVDLITFDDSSIRSYIIAEDHTILLSNVLVDNDSDLYSEELVQILNSNYTIDNALLYSAQDLSNGWTLLMINDDFHVSTLLAPVIIYLISGTFILLFLALIVIYIITKQATKPLQALIAQVNEVSLSNLSINTQATTFDEFELLNSAFSDMFTRLKDSMAETERRKTYELQANLIALQSQMDPHFLYNILTVIKSMNREKSHNQIDFCCNYLAKMLRYISSYRETEVSLHQELEHATQYLNLMKFRYENQFNFYINIEPELDVQKIYLNKLVIQPLLENCFQHGFKTVVPIWNIWINCYISENYWHVSVIDNGGGITDEQIKHIEDTVSDFTQNPSISIPQLSLGGMGLINTLSRLKLHHDANIHFAIEHNYPTGTIIIIKGELSHESTDY